MKVYFIGAGPGDPELITVKGKKIVQEADVIIYAGSLVNPAVFSDVAGAASPPEGPTVHESSREGPALYDSSGMTLDQVRKLYLSYKDTEGIVARLHTGDPSIYGAIQEQIDFLKDEGIPFEVVPGVSSASAAAAALGREYTLPGVSQSVILSRISGRTKTPPAEDIALLAEHKATMVLFLSAGKMKETVEKLKTGYSEDTPAAVVYRASWPDEKIVTGTLSTIESKAAEAGITRQALIIVGDVLQAGRGGGEYELSKLYDSGFTHGYRNGNAHHEEHGRRAGKGIVSGEKNGRHKGDDNRKCRKGFRQ